MYEDARGNRAMSNNLGSPEEVKTFPGVYSTYGRLRDGKPKGLKKEPKAGKKAADRARAKHAATPRADSKGSRILELIRRPKGATLAEIRTATDWQAYSVRGFLSTAAEKHGLKIESADTMADAAQKIVKLVA